MEYPSRSSITPKETQLNISIKGNNQFSHQISTRLASKFSKLDDEFSGANENNTPPSPSTLLCENTSKNNKYFKSLHFCFPFPRLSKH